MSAMAKFIGVNCLPCLRAGHHCQAQMKASSTRHSGVTEPMCLRCANDEPCFAVTAPLHFETPARMLNDGYEGMVYRSGRGGGNFSMSGVA